MAKLKLSPLDQRLLALLGENARTSTAELARTLEVTRSTVLGHMRRLENQGVIRGYSVVYGEAYEQQLVSAHVLIVVHQKLTTQTNRQLEAIPEIISLYAISGDYDMMAVVRTESTEALSRLLDRIGNLEGVERTNSSLILEAKFNR